MMNSEDKSLVFDTSTIIKLARQYHGFEIVKELFKKVENKKINGFISNLTSYETIITFGERGIRESIKILDNLETAGFKSIGFSKETARKARGKASGKERRRNSRTFLQKIHKKRRGVTAAKKKNTFQKAKTIP